MATRQSEIPRHQDPLEMVILPHAVGAEKAILGAILLENDCIDEAIGLLRPGDFYLKTNRRLYSAMLELRRRNEPIDLNTLGDYLRQRGEFEQVGGATEIALLIDGVPRTDIIEPYAKIVKQKATVRAIISAANSVLSLAVEDPDAPDLLARSQQMIFDACAYDEQTGFVHLGAAAAAYLETVEAIRNDQSGGNSILTGFDEIDRHTLGLARGDLFILAARPSNGKTTLAQNIAQNIGSRGFKVAFFSQEMSAGQLAEKSIAATAHVDSFRMRAGCLNDSDWQNAMDSLGQLYGTDVYICDTSKVSSSEVKAKALRLRRSSGLDLIVVDFLQMMKGDPRQDKRERVGENARDLKAIAKDLNVPVLCLAQTSRRVEGRTSNEPELTDLKESGDIEEAADAVVFIYNENDTVAGDVITLKVGKNRNGQAGVYERLAYRKSFNLITSLQH